MVVFSYVLLVQCLYLLVPGSSANLASSLERYGLQDVEKYRQCGDTHQLQSNECYYRELSYVSCLNVTVRYDMCKSVDTDADNDDSYDGNDDLPTGDGIKSWQALKAYHNRHNGFRRRQMLFEGSCVEMEEGKCSLYQCVKKCCLGWKEDSNGQCYIRIGKYYCENGGTYDWHRMMCSCLHGYSGRKCEIPICEQGCYNNGVCVTSEMGERSCSCPSYTWGKQCENVICEEKCIHGTCIVDGVDGPGCLCNPGYYGKACQHSFTGDPACPVPKNPVCQRLNCSSRNECESETNCKDGYVCCNDGCCNSCVKLRQGCYDNGKVYLPRESFWPDKCTTCQCLLNGTLYCARKTCPALNCVDIELSDSDCCPRCKASNVIMFCTSYTRRVAVAGHRDIAYMKDLNIMVINEFGSQRMEVHYKPSTLRHCRCHEKDKTFVEVSAMIGNQTVATCQQPVIVVDNQSPEFIRCPGSMDAEYGEPVYWMEPMVSDNVGIASLESNLNRGSTFSSTVRITYTATDYDRNRAFCYFVIYISKTDTSTGYYGDYDTVKQTSSVGITVGTVGTAFIMVLLIILAVMYRRNRLKNSHYRQSHGASQQQNSRQQQRNIQLPINAISNRIYGDLMSRDGFINPNDFTPLPPPYSAATDPPPYEEVLQQEQVDNKPPDYEVAVSQQRDGTSV